MDITLIILLIVIVAPISVWIHEMGHLIGAKTVNANQLTLTLGIGKDRFTFKVKGITIIMRTIFFISGSTMTSRDRNFNRLERIWISIFGPLFNVLFANICIIIYMKYSYNIILLFFLFNIWLGIVNLIPYKIKGKCSDGYIILASLVNRK